MSLFIDAEIVTTNGYFSQIDSRVTIIQEKCSSMEKTHHEWEQKLEKLIQMKQFEVSDS